MYKEVDSREEQMLQIVEMYYQQGISQTDIAGLFGISRPSISRLIEEAKRRKIVEIFIHSRIPKNASLSCRIREQYNLKNCTVIESDSPYPETLKKCVNAAGSFFHSILKNGMTVAVSWGTAMNIFAEILEAKSYHNVHIAQAVGCLSTGNPVQDGVEVSRRIAEKLGATYSNIYAPVFVDSPVVRDYFLNESQIVLAVRKAMFAEIFITGIGSIGDKHSILSATGYISDEEWSRLKKRGCVAHLMGHMFDKEGRETTIENKHLISIPLEKLRNANLSVGISVFPEKAESVFAAVKAGYINSLFIDESLAKALLELYPINKTMEGQTWDR
jgi:deoxyribonucleoside regulator